MSQSAEDCKAQDFGPLPAWNGRGKTFISRSTDAQLRNLLCPINRRRQTTALFSES